MRPKMLLVLAVVACGRRAPAPGAAADPAFEARWAALGKAGVEVTYVGGGDSGAALEGNVRAVRPHRATPPPPSLGPAGQGELPEQPNGEALQQVIRSNLISVKGCYLTASRLGVAGKAIVSFTIGADGRPAGVQVDAPTFRGTALPGCLVATVSSWTFPKSQKGGGSVSYPFVFVGG